MSKYRKRTLNLSAGFDMVDGAAAISLNGKLIIAGGWDGNATPATTNQFYVSDDGITFSTTGNAPWQARHTFGHGVIGTEAFFWGGDFLNTDGAHREIWKYSDTNGHELVSGDWGNSIGDTILFSHCIHKGHMMVIGGQTDLTTATTFNNTVHKISPTGVVTKVADLPTGLLNRSTGVCYSYNDILYYGSGGIYNENGHVVFYNDLWSSTNDGVTWTQVLVDNRLYSMYPSGCVFDGQLWFSKGFYNGVNQRGIYYIDPESFTMKPVNVNIPPRHAASITKHNNALHILAGNDNGSNVRNDSYKYIKL